MITLIIAALSAEPNGSWVGRNEVATSGADFDAALELAGEAEADGQWAQALQAWQLARTMSPEAFDPAMGEVRALLALGRSAEAVTRARALSQRLPDNSQARLMYAWCLRQLTLLPDLASRRAGEVYRRGEEAEAWCGLAWVRLGRGDEAGARRAAALTDAGCRSSLQAALPRTVGVWGAFFGTGSIWHSDAVRLGGISGVAQVGARVGALVDLEATFRGAWVDFEDGVLTTDQASQFEGWGRVGLSGDGHGVSLLVGGLGGGWGSGWTLGGSAWGTLGLTGVFEGAYSHYSDGPAWQAGGRLIVPFTRWFRVDGGLEATAWTAASPAAAWDTGTPQLAGRGGLGLFFDRWELGASGWGGAAVRPIRLSEPTPYNVNALAQGGGSLRLGLSVGPEMWLRGGYDLTQYRSSVGDLSWLHLVTVGLTVAPTSEQREGR